MRPSRCSVKQSTAWDGPGDSCCSPRRRPTSPRASATRTRGVADRAAATAYAASLTMGAFTTLQRALVQFPTLGCIGSSNTSRRQPSGGDSSGPSIHRDSDRAGRTSGSVFDIRPFGSSPDIVVDGQAANVRRLKVLELACLLAVRPKGLRRDDAQNHLFPESDRQRGSNYFRQVVHQLRKSTGLTIQRLPDRDIAVSGQRARRCRRYPVRTNPRRGIGSGGRRAPFASPESLGASYRAVPLGSNLEWVSERRFQLDVLVEEAELEAAHLALELSDFATALRYSETALNRNPYSVPAYRVMMEIQVAVGSETAALAVYRRACDTLCEIGVEPDEAMTSLLKLPHV